MVNLCFWLFLDRKISKSHEQSLCGSDCHTHNACLSFCGVVALANYKKSKPPAGKQEQEDGAIIF
jgi:cytochrome c peroxidase